MSSRVVHGPSRVCLTALGAQVAATRAKHSLFLSHAEQRFIGGFNHRPSLSRFITPDLLRECQAGEIEATAWASTVPALQALSKGTASDHTCELLQRALMVVETLEAMEDCEEDRPEWRDNSDEGEGEEEDEGKEGYTSYHARRGQGLRRVASTPAGAAPRFARAPQRSLSSAYPARAAASFASKSARPDAAHNAGQPGAASGAAVTSPALGFCSAKAKMAETQKATEDASMEESSAVATAAKRKGKREKKARLPPAAEGEASPGISPMAKSPTAKSTTAKPRRKRSNPGPGSPAKTLDTWLASSSPSKPS
jgi:hypothetical protein